MDFEATPKQSLVLWNLLTNKEAPAVSKVKPQFTLAECKPLVDAGLIELEKRGRSTHLVLLDKSWVWALENPTMMFPERATSAIPVLEALIKITIDNVQLDKIVLAEFLRPQAQVKEESDDAGNELETIEEKIYEAYSIASNGSYNVRVHLSELRKNLDDFPREEVDKALSDMQRAGKLVLMPLDDPQEIRPEDEKAAIDMGGPKRHILYMKG